MKRFLNLLGGLSLSLILQASEGQISFNLNLSLISSRGIHPDSTMLTLSDGDTNAVELAVSTGNTINYLFDSLDAGNYFLAVQIYQGDHVIAESFSKGYLAADEKKVVQSQVSLACAYPILYVNWNPGLIVTGDDFFDFAIDPDSNYLKRYPLPHLDSLAQAFRDSGMHYYQEYPIHWGLLDTNLIPIVKYPWGFYRNPVTTSHTAFAFYDAYVKNRDSVSHLGFLNNVNWLLENWDSNFYLHYDFDFEHQVVSLDSGWVSGMAQGLALVAVSLAYYETGEQKYLDGAMGLFGTLNKNTGGYYSIAEDEQNYYWLEEYPSRDFCHVFNGYMAALWGLWCYYTISGDDFASVLLEAGIKTFVDNYPRWNIPNQDLSYYCLHKKIDPKYHEKHKVQLRTYGDYFRVKEMLYGANCFENRYFAAYPWSLKHSSDISSSKITTFSSLAWSAESNEDWLSLARKGDSLEVTCSENLFAQNRTARIYFTEADTNELQTIIVEQEGKNYLPLTKIDSIYVTADSGTLSFNLDLDTSWTVTSKANWIVSTMENDSVFIMKYQNNPYFDKRTGFVEVRVMDSILIYDIRILQDSLHPYLSLSPDSVWLNSDSGELKIVINANALWSVSYDSSWINAHKINDTLLLVKYMEHLDYFQSRMTNLTLSLEDSLAVRELKIGQSPRPLYIKVDQVSQFIDSDSGFVLIKVEAPVNWTAKPFADWLFPVADNDSILRVIYLINVSYEPRMGVIYVSLNDTIMRSIRFYQSASTVGINSAAGASKIEVYPNPATSKVHLRIGSHTPGPLMIEIFSLSGEKVMAQHIPYPGDHVELDISKLGKGVFFVKVITIDHSYIRKLVIE